MGAPGSQELYSLARIQVFIVPVTRCPRPGSPPPLPALEEGIQVEDILLVLSSAGHVQNLTLALSWSIVSVKTLTTLDTCTQDGGRSPLTFPSSRLRSP